jgi:hypothetical protein
LNRKKSQFVVSARPLEQRHRRVYLRPFQICGSETAFARQMSSGADFARRVRAAQRSKRVPEDQP